MEKQTETTFVNILAVVDHLAAQGWKIKKSAAYLHASQGKLLPQSDGSYTIRAVEKYAKLWLKRRDGRKIGGGMENLQQERVQAETRKVKAQADHWENRARASSGSFISKEQYERDLARRCATFRRDLETFARTEAREVVSFVGGNVDKIPELIDWMLDHFRSFLAVYAEERKFEIPLLLVEKEMDADLDEDDEDYDESEGLEPARGL